MGEANPMFGLTQKQRRRTGVSDLRWLGAQICLNGGDDRAGEAVHLAF